MAQEDRVISRKNIHNLTGRLAGPVLRLHTLAHIGLLFTPGIATAATRNPGIAASVPRSEWRSIVTGRLSNGVRFAILPRTGHEPGVGLLMRDQGGFFAERRPGERGLAHLIEHVALVSPTKGAPKDWDHFTKLGLQLTLPAPSVGTTSWRETNYFLSTRTTKPADLGRLLGLFREVATDLTFRADAVDGQREDVMREMARRHEGNVSYASFVAAIAPGSPTDVIEAQNSDDVPTASIDTIRGLYHRLYRPENIMVVVVGDVDPKFTAQLIRKHFADWLADGPAPTTVPVPGVRSDHVAPISYSVAPVDRSTALFTVAAPVPPPAEGHLKQLDAELMQLLVTRAVNGRLRTQFPSASAGKVGMTIDDGQGYRLLILWDDFGDADWQQALVGLHSVTCDLTEKGFSAAEWAQAKRELLGNLRWRVSTMREASNVEVAKDLSHALAAGHDLLSPVELLARAEAQLPGIDAATGSAWWRHEWQAGVRHVRVQTPELIKVSDPTAAIRKFWPIPDPHLWKPALMPLAIDPTNKRTPKTSPTRAVLRGMVCETVRAFSISNAQREERPSERAIDSLEGPFSQKLFPIALSRNHLSETEKRENAG